MRENHPAQSIRKLGHQELEITNVSMVHLKCCKRCRGNDNEQEYWGEGGRVFENFMNITL